VELGSRVNIHSEYGSHYVFNFNPSYLINNQIKLFGNLSSAYRTPSLYQLFSEYGNKNLKPETAITGEVGLQYFSSDKKLNSRAVIFNRHVSDVIFFYFNNSTFQSQYINQDKQKDKGIELETTYQPINNLTIKTFFSYVTGSITTKTGTGKDTSYFNLLRRPKNSFGLNLSYRINKQFFISTNLSAFGKREDAYFNLQTFLKEDVVLKSYMLWDLYAEYLFPKNKFRAFADFKNITNSKYTEISGFNTLRFNATGGIRFNF
jgi:vitamin B12 transporter